VITSVALLFGEHTEH